MIKTCARCGKEFEARHANAKYCSDECRLEAKRESNRRWALNNPDKVRESRLRWETANPEKRKKYYQQWRDANLEKCRLYSRRWRERNPEKNRAKNHRWYHTVGKHKLWVKKRAARLRKILEEKAAARQAAQPERERHWTEYSSLSLVSSCQATYIY